MDLIPEIYREPVLSILALEIEKALDYYYEIRRRSNVDIISSMMLGKYEIAALVQRVLDGTEEPEEISRRIRANIAKWYTLRSRQKRPAVLVSELIEKTLEEEMLS